MNETLDGLARALTRPMPRGRALRLMAGAAFAVAVPGLQRPQFAIAGTRSSSVLSGVCEKSCSGHFPVPCLCKGPTHGCFETCGVAGSTCCCQKGADGKNAGVVACPPGTRCGRSGETNCVCTNTCGSPSTCCGADQFCANPASRLCCNNDWRGCGTFCCKPNEECRKIRVGTSSSSACEQRCPPSRAWCGRSTCCPPRWHCVNERTGLCKRCSRTQEECGTKCCDRSTSRCCGKAGCCPKGRACCNNGGNQQICCPAGQKCAIPILAGDIGVKPRTESICCPAERYHANPTLCCPPGQVALNQPGMQVGPGLSPFCCPSGQLCGTGGARTCCQRSDALGSQTCCNGKCVDTQFDPDNCGRCGNVCASRTCSKGVCAFT